MKISFLSLLFLIFLTLKLCHVIEWSWIWVFLPLFAPLIVLTLFNGILLGIAIISVLCDKAKIKLRQKLS